MNSNLHLQKMKTWVNDNNLTIEEREIPCNDGVGKNKHTQQAHIIAKNNL